MRVNAKSRHWWSFLPTLSPAHLSASLSAEHIFLTRQQIIRLAPTVMSLSSSIYKAMNWKLEGGNKWERLLGFSTWLAMWKRSKQVRRAYPSLISVSPGKQTHRERQNEVCHAQMPGLCLSFSPDDLHGTMESYFYKRIKGGGWLGKGADKRFQFPFYFSHCGWIKEKLNWKDQFKNHRQKIEARPMFRVWCHICPRFWG